MLTRFPSSLWAITTLEQVEVAAEEEEVEVDIVEDVERLCRPGDRQEVEKRIKTG